MARSKLPRGAVPKIALLACAASLGACQGDNAPQAGQIAGGATKQVRDVEPSGGFLPDPALLNKGGQTNFALMYRKPGVAAGTYHAIILDPVTIWTGPNSPVANVPAAERQGLANMFTSELYQTLKTKCRFTQNSGPGTVHIRIALVDAEATNRTLNTIATYAPYVSAAYGLASVGFNNGVALFAGSATIEGYAVDSQNNQILWEGVDKRAGTPALVKDTLDSKRDIQVAFNDWSKKFLVGMQEVGLCRP